MTGQDHATDLRVYRRLLALCPEGFRREYAAAMEQAFADLSREPRHQGSWGRARLWLLSAWDLAVTAVAERSRTMGDVIARNVGRFGLRNLMVANAVLFILLGLSIIGPPGPGAWLRSLRVPLDVAGTDLEASAPYALTRLLAVALISFGALLLGASRAAGSSAGATISGALCVAYGLGGLLLLLQQTQIWINVAGAVTVAVAGLLTVAYGAAYLVHRGRDRVPAP